MIYEEVVCAHLRKLQGKPLRHGDCWLQQSFVESWTKVFVSCEWTRDVHLVSAGVNNMSVNIGEHRAVIQQSIRIMDAVHIQSVTKMKLL